jgi:hypothetical protein
MTLLGKIYKNKIKSLKLSSVHIKIEKHTFRKMYEKTLRQASESKITSLSTFPTPGYGLCFLGMSNKEVKASSHSSSSLRLWIQS